MSASTADPVRSVRETWPIFLAAAIGGIYAFGHLSWFLGTPLGRVPVLDAREGIAFANAIVSGQIPAEPFYRAPGYALLLAAVRTCGISAGALFGTALTLGALFHAVNAALTAVIARRWFGVRVAALAGLFVAVDPVLVHFAVQASDATPALTCFLAGLASLAPVFVESTSRPRTGRWMIASVCWATATIFRPNYFLVWLTLPLLVAIAARSSRRAEGSNLAEPVTPAFNRNPHLIGVLTAACTGTLLFILIAAWQFHLCGRPGFLPAQGAYNLWAANQPGAHGRYYTQKLALPAALAEQNPARAESILLYETETGQAAPNLDTVNAYWRARFVAYITRHPIAWATQLGRKLYALLNDWEQYNNETPAFHLARSPWLRWNPLSWGVFFVFAVAGFTRFAAEQRRAIAALGIVIGATAASALLFFVSARFRLPLVPLAAILAAAALGSPKFAMSWPKPRQLVLGLLCAAALFIAYSNFGGVRDRATFVQDHALLARAAATTGDDALAWQEAEAALALRPDHPDALRLAVASYFNLLLSSDPAPQEEAHWRDAATRLLATTTPDAPDLRAVAAVALWRASDTSAALTEWRRLGSTRSALAARWLVHDASVPSAELKEMAAAGSPEPLVQLAIAHLPTAPASMAPLRATAARIFRQTSTAR